MKRRSFLKLALSWPLLNLASQPTRPQPAPNAPNIIVLVFDTFSAAHASFLGYRRQTTPHLARFADRATVYQAHYTAANFTTPATASLLTGVYPWTHRAFHINGTVQDRVAPHNLFSAFDASGYERIVYTHNTLVTLLLDQFRSHLDYYLPPRALALLDNLVSDQLFPNDYVTAVLGEKIMLPKDSDIPSTSLFGSLFNSLQRQQQINALRLKYADQFPRGIPRADEHTRYFILEDAIAWIMAQASQVHARPYLMYVHLYPPHGPYNTRREFINTFEDDGLTPLAKPPHFFSAGLTQAQLDRNRRQYDEFVPYVDAEFGRLYDALQAQGSLDNTYLVVTSDHGQLFERGIHGHITSTLFEPVIRIPLLIAQPGQTARVDVRTPTTSLDLLPTLLQWAGQPIPEWCEGQVLPPFLETDLDSERTLFAVEAKRNPKQRPLTQATIAMRKGPYKLVYYLGYDGYSEVYEMYDVQQDPEELNNLYAPSNPTAQALQAELLFKLRAVNEPFN